MANKATVAVTGADGFVGSHLCEALLARGHQVRALVQYNPFGSWGWLEECPPSLRSKLEVVLGDVRDPGLMLEFVKGTTQLVHLAALIAIPYSYRAPRSYLETNVLGTLNLLEAARQVGLERIVHTSTSEVYGSAQRIPMDENHPLNAQSPYAASKLGADQLVNSFCSSYELPAVTLRPFNTFGPRQSVRAVIPTVIGQLAMTAPGGQASVRLGTTSTTRDFNYVLDTVAAFLAVLDAPLERVVGQVFNAGNGLELSVAALVQEIAALMGRSAQTSPDLTRLRPERSEVLRLVSDSSKLRAATGWQPQWDLRSGLERTVNWFSQPDRLSRRAADYGI